MYEPGTNAAVGAEATIMSACRSCIGPCFGQRQACTVRVSVQDKRSVHGQGRIAGVYRCDIRSVQQDCGDGRWELRRELGVKGAIDSTSILDAWGVKE